MFDSDVLLIGAESPYQILGWLVPDFFYFHKKMLGGRWNKEYDPSFSTTYHAIIKSIFTHDSTHFDFESNTLFIIIGEKRLNENDPELKRAERDLLREIYLNFDTLKILYDRGEYKLMVYQMLGTSVQFMLT